MVDGRILYRIKALRDIPSHGVKKGDLGGYIESRWNLSQDGDAWVGDKAMVYDYAQVSGNAWIHERARIWENARVYGNAKIGGDTEVRGNSSLY